jgi:hypothetical protein
MRPAPGNAMIQQPTTQPPGGTPLKTPKPQILQGVAVCSGMLQEPPANAASHMCL